MEMPELLANLPGRRFLTEELPGLADLWLRHDAFAALYPALFAGCLEARLRALDHELAFHPREGGHHVEEEAS